MQYNNIWGKRKELTNKIVPPLIILSFPSEIITSYWPELNVVNSKAVLRE